MSAGGRRPDHGFSLAELLIVVAILAIAAAAAAPVLWRAMQASHLETARAEIASRLRTTSERAAATGSSQWFVARDVPVASDVVLFPPSVSGPERTAPADRVAFQGGTGYPLVDTRRSAVHVVVAQRGQETTLAYALVLGESGTMRQYRLVSGQKWEEMR